jgi:hypothetical protein
MDSDEKKFGGGSGGDDEIKWDRKDIDGGFSRAAHLVLLSATPLKSWQPLIALTACGDKGHVDVQGGRSVLIRTGDAGDIEGFSTMENVIYVYAPQDASILLQRGNLSDPSGQTIAMTADGNITIYAGVSGTIFLRAGPVGEGSCLAIAPDGVTIDGALLQLNK